MSRHRFFVMGLGTALLGACAVAPPVAGPEIQAMPGKGKTFAQFQQDDVTCRQYAAGQTGAVPPAQVAEQSTVNSAVVGTALGAAAGALLGAAGGHIGSGAAIGAGAGLLVGSIAGTGTARASGAAVQRRYDIAYAQCMAANGEKIPDPTAPPPSYPYSAPPPGYYYPSEPPSYYYGPYWGWSH